MESSLKFFTVATCCAIKSRAVTEAHVWKISNSERTGVIASSLLTMVPLAAKVFSKIHIYLFFLGGGEGGGRLAFSRCWGSFVFEV